MLGKRIINTGAVSCTTDTTQILNAGSTESIALYRFEDNAFDTSGSTGYINKGAKFNGSSSIITLAAGSFTYTAPFSIAAWIKQTAQDSSDIILENYDYQSSTSRGFIFRTQSGKLRFDGYYSDATRTEAKSNESIPLNTWTHVACVWDNNNSSIKLYINGSEATYSVQTFNAMQYHASCPVTIGALSYTGASNEQYYTGYIDELRIYNDALTSAEIGYIANNTTASIPTGNLAAHYQFEGNANDSTSSPINGTATNVIYDYDGAASNVTYTTGKFDKAAEFNGSSSFINIENMSTVLANDFTVSFWVKTPSSFPSSGYPTFLSLYGYPGSGTAYGWSVEISAAGASSKIMFYWVSSAHVGNYLQSAVLSTNTWYHVVAKKDSSSASLYINGQLDHSGGSSVNSYGMYYSSFTDLTIGAKRLIDGGSTSYHFTGLIDQVRLFTTQLNSGEINSLYNETATSAASATIDNPSTLAYYKMADGTDETGNYNGTTANVDFNVAGKYGFAGKFNGSSSKITISGSPFNLTTYSLSFWIYASDYNQSGTSIINIGLDNTGGSWGGIAFGVNANKVFYYGGDTVGAGGTGFFTQTGTTNITNANWVHVTIVVNGTSITGYINGTQDSGLSRTLGANITYRGGSINTIGVRQGAFGSYGWWNGKVDQVRIFNKAISASEVTTLYNEIQCANTITAPESYFNTKLFTPTTSSSALPVTGVGFAPGFAWAKYRGTGSGASTQSHYLVDTVRGLSSLIYSNSNAAAYTASAYVQSFDSDGITYVNNLFNRTGADSVVGWFWKAGSSNVTNNDGTLTSTVSASPESGFSIVRYTGTSNYSDTLGHGLTKAPRLVLQKAIGNTSDWYPLIDLTENGTWDWAKLNTNQAFSPDNPTRFSANSKTINNWGWTGYDMINYCFHDVPGYQRIGTYVGNGETTGPYIYTGFEPAWIMIKRTDAAGAYNIFDNKRNSTNPRNSILQANVSDQEYTNTNYNFNFYTNGFQALNSNADWNASGGSYIFIAIAANPDTTAPTKANSFKTKIYTGTGSTHAITGLGFKPDFIWTKNRDTTDSSALVDSVRGIVSPAPYLASDATTASATSTNMPTSVQADGYTITGAGGRTNTSGEDYVSWNWKAADHDRNLAAINNDGSIPSVVSANPAAGFSIVSWNGTQVNDSIGHGLLNSPEIIILKDTSNAYNWYVFTKPSGASNNLRFEGLNTDNAATTQNSQFTTTSTLIENLTTFASLNTSGASMLAYCWHSVTGYSKVGSYTGQTAGVTITTGFQPSFIMIKSSSNVEHWAILDTERGTGKVLNPNRNNAESDSTLNTFTVSATGFSFPHQDTADAMLNENGYQYIYLAIK